MSEPSPIPDQPRPVAATAEGFDGADLEKVFNRCRLAVAAVSDQRVMRVDKAIYETGIGASRIKFCSGKSRNGLPQRLNPSAGAFTAAGPCQTNIEALSPD
jgi:hypothetical protein